MPLVNQSLCDQDYGPKEIDNNNMFCAGLQQGGKDSCQVQKRNDVLLFQLAFSFCNTG